ncbi:MAG TPA: flagellar protein FlaG [Clostridiaceae bacterium]|nr:flagellar protein FlaG [Clostridiaceae bacterium]
MIKIAKDNINNTGVINSKEISEKQNRTEYIKKKLSELNEFERRELPVSEKVVLEAIERANKAISLANRRLEYSIHEKTNEIIVKVINTETEEVIREIPPEKMLDMVACIWEMIGIIVDERR